MVRWRLTPPVVGLAMMLVSFLNVILSRSAVRDSLARRLVYVANHLTLAFGAMAVAHDCEPQVVFGMLLVGTITVMAFLLKRKPHKDVRRYPPRGSGFIV